MKSLCSRALVASLVLVALLAWSQPALASARAVAGLVDAPADVTPYLLVKAVESKSGMTARSTKLDATHTFSFAGLPASVDTVEVVAQLPGHLFTLQPDASVLSVPIPAAGDAPVQLKVAVTAAHPGTSAASGDESKGSIGSAIVAAVGLVAMWAGRHQIVGLLDMPGLRLPKQKKVVMPR